MHSDLFTKNKYLLPILFGLALLTFIILKIPHLSVPLFWDEAGVYGRMCYELADHQLSLHPKVIDQWVSR
jgi:hypothetical protein